MNQSHSSSFGLYEVFRILIPGFYFSSLSLIFYYAFLYQYFSIEIHPLMIIYFLFILVSGLTMYAKETTKKRRAFIENRPSEYLQNLIRQTKSSQLLDEDESRQLYFYILNHYFPTFFHEKVFFFGTVYHIMIQIRRSTFWYTILSLLCISIQIAIGISLDKQQGFVAFTIFISILYLIFVKYNKADRKMQENYLDQIFWLRMNEDLLKDILKKYERLKRGITP